MHGIKFHHFIIITIIVPLEHDSVIWENPLGTAPPARKHEFNTLIAADISRFRRSDVVAASNMS